jgi:hypothetical protein
MPFSLDGVAGKSAKEKDLMRQYAKSMPAKYFGPFVEDPEAEFENQTGRKFNRLLFVLEGMNDIRELLGMERLEIPDEIR